MSLLSQKTIAKKIFVSGIGVHTGDKVNLNILPSSPNSGIIFKRTDLKKNNIVIPNFVNVSDATLCTTISNEFGVKVSTIEHLMGAFYGLGIDNAIVEIDSQELPILDGSAKNFVKLIREVGVKDSDVPIKLIKVNKKIEIKEGEKFISIDKSNVALEIDFEIKYENQLINNQKNKVNIYEDNLEDVYNSRTFCLFEDVEKIKKKGLAKGGSLENAVVVKDDAILNKEGLRYKNEFVMHKILDCLGDLMLCGNRIRGSIVCSQGGHQLTYELIKKIFSNKENWALENQVLNKLQPNKKTFPARIAISA